MLLHGLQAHVRALNVAIPILPVPSSCSLLPEKMLCHALGDVSQGGNQPQLPPSPDACSWGAQNCPRMSMVRRSRLAKAAGTLLLLGWLAGRWPGRVFGGAIWKVTWEVGQHGVTWVGF